MRKHVLTLTAACGFFSTISWTQEKPAFEVASVRAHSPGEGQFSFDVEDSGRLTTRNMTVWDLIRQAYGWRDSQISGGPAWIKTDGYDVVAVAGQPAPVERSRVLGMLQVLLQKRFHLHWHEQVRETTAYALRVAPGGPKLAPAKGGSARLQKGNIVAPSMTIESLCQILEFELAKPVVDQTGLRGSYAVELQWARDNPSAAQEPDTSRPSVFTAVREQLGLRLESAKLPVKTFVIDDVQRPPDN
jgi:uncharacterized protein (TIGR03435 family)